MAYLPIQADALEFHIYDADGTPAAYVEIGGLDTIQPARSTKTADFATKTSVDAAGNAIEQPAPVRRGKSWQLEGKFLMDDGTSAQDPGQALCEEWADKTGIPGALNYFKVVEADGTDNEFRGWIQVDSDGGGEKDEAAGWSATVWYWDDDTPS